MAGRQIFNPDGYKNVEVDGVKGYQFEFKHQYYRGFTPSILREIKANVDGCEAKKEDIRMTFNNVMFTLDELETLIDPDFRWEFSDYATVTVLDGKGLAPGKHHIVAFQKIAPSYMPFTWDAQCEDDFEIKEEA